MNHTRSTVCIAAFFVSLLVLLLSNQRLVYCVANVAVYPSIVAAGQGQSFVVNVTISSVSKLYGWELKLNWTSSYLDAVSVSEGPFLKTGGNTFFTNRINNTEGHLIVDCTLLGTIPGVTGEGVLASLTFHVKSAGQCLLDLYGVSLLDDSLDPQSIPCETSGGYWSSVVSSHDVSISSISLFPTAVFPGQAVNINITASNIGTYSETFQVTAFINSETIGQSVTTLDPGYSKTLPFVWNTTGRGKDEYTVSAFASAVQGETDIADNNMTAPQTVAILTTGHDIAVTSVRPSKTVVGQGFCMFINLTVRNFGEYSETFNTTTDANDTVIHTDPVTLASGFNTQLTFLWNVSGFAMGGYVIESFAEPVSGETNTSDNTLRFGQVSVARRGDINGIVPNVPDGRVDMKDVAVVAKSFGAHPGDSSWNGNADVTGVTLGLPDDVIDMRDISFVARNFNT